MEKILENKDIFKEVLVILSYFNEDVTDKIPRNVFNKIKDIAADSKENFYIDPNKSLDEQDISEQSKDLISLIYYDYMATEEEKVEISKLWNENEKKYQQELKNKYSDYDLFKKQVKNVIRDENKKVEKTTSTEMIEYKKYTIFDKIKRFLKKVFKKRI